MLEHHHWRGPNYEEGIEKQRIAIVGYSHYRQPTECDFPDFTRWVMKNEVLSGEKNIAFFRQISGYFDQEIDFWNRVVFFNFLPHCIGCEAEKFLEGSMSEIEVGRRRVLRVLEEEKPDKVLVFSSKGWRAFPPTVEERYGTWPLGDSFPPEFRWGTYRFRDHTIRVYGLRHPQGANHALMTRAVRAIETAT